MGKIFASPKVKLICAVLFNRTIAIDEILDVLTGQWGTIDGRSPVYDFHHTDYYRDEFGGPLNKQFVSFEKLIDIERVPDVKIKSNTLEEKWKTGEKRNVNVDPGYVANAKLVLPTTKNLPHRVYIGKNIYADLQLIYKKPTFHAIAWTFADYKEPLALEFFNSVQEKYMNRIKEDRIAGE